MALLVQLRGSGKPLHPGNPMATMLVLPGSPENH